MKLIVISFAVLMALWATGCNSSSTSTELNVGYANHDHHAAVFVMAAFPDQVRLNDGTHLEEIEYQKRYKIVKGKKQIGIIQFTASTGAIQIISKLDHDHFDVALGGVPSMITVIDGGSELRIIAPVMTNGAGFVFKKEANVHSWREFVEYVKASDEIVQIGYKEDVSVQNLVFESSLEYEGLNYRKFGESTDAQIEMINLYGAGNLLKALEDQLIDGFVVMQPYVAMSLEQGSVSLVELLDRLPPEGKWVDHPCCALAVRSQSVLDEKRNLIRVFVSLMYKANEVITENPELVASTIASWIGTTESIELASIPTIHYLQGYTEDWEKGIQTWVATLLQQHELSGKVLNAYENNTLMKEIYITP